MNGVALDNSALSWNIQQGYGTDGVGYTGTLNGDYKGTYGKLRRAMGTTNIASALAMVCREDLAHADGVTLSQPLGKPTR